MYSVLVSLHS